jgi:conjugal transfer pilus assembly protein TraF
VSSYVGLRRLGLLCMLLVVSPTMGQTPQTCQFYTDHAIGWHWYDDPRLEVNNKQTNVTTSDPITDIKIMRQTLERALDDALLHPSTEKVTHYIHLQNQWSERASLFSSIWQWVLWQHPELDYSIRHPTNQVGRTVYLDKLTAAQEAAIKTLAQQNGLFFFYQGKCAYCQRFAPIVKSFSERYHMPIIAITLDGILLPEFPQSYRDEGHAQRFHIDIVPALFTVNPYTHQSVPIAWGLISEADLRQRILDVAMLSRRMGN